MSILTKIKSTADITGGAVFFATSEGFDPEYPENGDLLPDGMYIRLEGSDGSLAYVSAYELDKSMAIIGQMSMGKANSADVEALQTELNDKVSNTDFELLQNDLSTKADQSIVEAVIDEIDLKADKTTVESLTSTVADKADKTNVESLTSTVADKADKTTVESLTSTVADKADKTTVESLKKDIVLLQELIGSVSDESVIAGIQRQIEYLNSEINKRLTIDDLIPIKTNVSNLINKDTEILERIDVIEGNVNKKASTIYVQGQISELNTAITSLASNVETKANKKELANKADKSDVESLTKKVTSLSSTVNGTLGNIDNNYREISAELTKKADKTLVDSALDSLEESVSNKIDRSEAIATTDSIENRLDTIESTNEENYIKLASDIENIDCTVNNTLTEFRSTINSQTKQINNQTTQIVNLQKADNEIKEQLKNEWVRVMTPEEYNRLAPVNDANPFAKKSNVIYMLVRYNKPVAVYIGDILIAQAEQKGPQGFTYNFPIIF